MLSEGGYAAVGACEEPPYTEAITRMNSVVEHKNDDIAVIEYAGS